MAVAAIYQQDVPSAHSAFFVSGEKALSVADPIGTAPGRTLFYLSKWFNLRGGEYIIRAASADAAQWSLSSGGLTGRRFLSTGTTAVEATIYLAPGRQRIDITLSNISVAASSCYAVFSLWQRGKLVYASAGSGWVFDTAPVADASVPDITDPRLSMPVFTVLPNWATGVIERIGYSTEVLPSETDAEQRRSLRVQPTRMFEAGFARHGSRRAMLENFVLGMARGVFLLPIWPEQVVITSTLSDTLALSPQTIAQREFRAGMVVMVNAKDPSVYEVLVIESVNMTTGVVTFADAPTLTWPAGTRVTPLRKARLLDQAAMSNLTDAVGTVSLRFRIEDSEPIWYEPSWGYCSPLFRFPINYANGVEVAYDQATALITESDHGPTEVFDLPEHVRLSLRASLQLRGRAEVFTFRQFIDMARGRAHRFWMPSFTADAELIDQLGADFIDVRNAGLSDYVQWTPDHRLWIVIEFNDGRSPVYREVERFEKIAAASERIHFTASIPSALMSVVQRVSFMLPVRFDQESFELLHLVDDNKVVTTSVLARSSTADDLPPIECGSTSLPYPLESVDALSSGFSVLAPYYWGIAPDGMDMGVTIPSLSLEVTVFYSTQTMNDEALDMAFVIPSLSLEVTVVYSETTMADEALYFSFSIPSLSLVRTVIQTTMLDEALNFSFEIGAISLE